MCKLVLRALAIVAIAGTLSVPTHAQAVDNYIPANCTQTSSTTISCKSTLTFTVPAGAVTLQSQPAGTGFALSSTGSSVNPSCTVSAPTSASAGTTVTLSANCPAYTAGYTYQWTAPAISSAPAGQTTNATMTSGGMNYSVTVCYADQLTRCSTVPGAIADTGSGVTVPASCRIDPQSPTVSSGATLSLTAACTGGSAAEHWEWKKDGVSVGTDSATLNDITFPSSSQATTATYTVRIRNSAGYATDTSLMSSTATKQTSTAVINYCPTGQPYPNYEWFNSTALNHTDIIPQYGDNIYTIKFSISATQSTVGRALATLPQIIFAEAPASMSSNKDVYVSQNPCDFTTSAQPIGVESLDGWRYVSLNDPSRTGFGFARLTTGVWYINVRNRGCSGVCGTRVQVSGGFN